MQVTLQGADGHGPKVSLFVFCSHDSVGQMVNDNVPGGGPWRFCAYQSGADEVIGLPTRL